MGRVEKAVTEASKTPGWWPCVTGACGSVCESLVMWSGCPRAGPAVVPVRWRTQRQSGEPGAAAGMAIRETLDSDGTQWSESRRGWLRVLPLVPLKGHFSFYMGPLFRARAAPLVCRFFPLPHSPRGPVQKPGKVVSPLSFVFVVSEYGPLSHTWGQVRNAHSWVPPDTFWGISGGGA